MRICRTIKEIQDACANLRVGVPNFTLGFVPTMGALHAGHLSLVSAAQAECDGVVASIFVNPLQFGAGEDYDLYPRTFDEDCRLLESAGVDLLFAPGAAEMYPPGANTIVEVRGIGDRLDGASRPGHFRGVATIVAKLFHIVAPQRAYFGQKDAARVAVLRAIIRDLHFPVELIACPTMRDPDGLAMSSRNRYLSTAERKQAVLLRKALDAAAALLADGETETHTLQDAILRIFANDPDVRIDYVAIVDPTNLEPISDTSGGALIAVAVWIGKTRLIDNFVVEASAVTCG